MELDDTEEIEDTTEEVDEGEIVDVISPVCESSFGRLPIVLSIQVCMDTTSVNNEGRMKFAQFPV